MADPSDDESDRLELLMSLAQIQDKLKPLHARVNKLVAERAGVLQELRNLGLTPKDIRRLTGVPLSTIYANTTPARKPEGERREDG